MDFFQNIAASSKKQQHIKQLPPIVDSGWRPPQYYPNLDNAPAIALDTETREFDWARGTGWPRGKSHVVGFSVAACGGKWYFPIRHEVEREYNLDPNTSLAWLKTIMETRCPKVGQNLMFDIGTLRAEGINVQGPLYDTSFAEALIDETAYTNLDALARKYLNRSKTSNTLYEWCSQAYGGSSKDQRRNIYRCSPRLVGPYGEDDADLPLHIIAKQWPLLEQQNLVTVYNMEANSIRMLIEMRWRGVNIDINKAHQLYGKLGVEINQLYNELSYTLGFTIDSVMSAAQVTKAIEATGMKAPRNTQKETLRALKNPVVDKILRIRALEKLQGTFVREYLLEGTTNNRLHPELHPLRNADSDTASKNGAKTGRYAASDPNVQNIPVRTAEGKLVRECFIPEYGHMRWRKRDYSQIEYRMLAHFATSDAVDTAQRTRELAACEALRQEYIANPKTDYHNRVFYKYAEIKQWIVEAMPKSEIADKRRPIKNVNFGLIYGQSEKSLAYTAGMSDDEARIFFPAYHEAAPYAKCTMQAISNEVQHFGFVRTILDRRTRFNLWEPERNWERDPAMPYHLALMTYGARIVRAFAYRGTNYKFQGSAAEVIKAAMVRCHMEGVFDVTGYPKLQVHDELDLSEIDDSPQQTEAYAYMKHVMETVIPCRVPILVDDKHGINWGVID